MNKQKVNWERYIYHPTVIHVGQIAAFLQFDNELQTRSDTQRLTSVPFGFVDFAKTWNTGSGADGQHVSVLTLDGENSTIELTSDPVLVRDFYITPEQTGLVDDVRSSNMPPSLQNQLLQNYATTMLKKQSNQLRGYETRKEKRLRGFGDSDDATGAGSSSSDSHSFFARPKSTNKRMRTLRSDLSAPSSEMAREEAVAVSSELDPVPEDASDLEPQAPMETTE